MTQATSTNRTDPAGSPGRVTTATHRVPGTAPEGAPQRACAAAARRALTRAIAYLHQHQRPEGEFPIDASPARAAMKHPPAAGPADSPPLSSYPDDSAAAPSTTGLLS